MNLTKMNPWNWFKKEEEEDRSGAAAPAKPAPAPAHAAASPLVAFHDELDRVFNRAFEGFGFDFPHLPDFPASHFRPKVDIAGGEKEYTIAVELPGVDEKDIHVDLSGDELTISAETRREEKSEDKGYYRTERSYGSFARVLTLPEDADAEGIRANAKNGVVTITVPRRAGVNAPAKRIAVEGTSRA